MSSDSTRPQLSPVLGYEYCLPAQVDVKVWQQCTTNHHTKAFSLGRDMQTSKYLYIKQNNVNSHCRQLTRTITVMGHFSKGMAQIILAWGVTSIRPGLWSDQEVSVWILWVDSLVGTSLRRTSQTGTAAVNYWNSIRNQGRLGEGEGEGVGMCEIWSHCISSYRGSQSSRYL